MDYIQKARVMDNDRYTLALITEENGIRTINHLNCNMKFRIEYHYRTGEMVLANKMKSYSDYTYRYN